MSFRECSEVHINLLQGTQQNLTLTFSGNILKDQAIYLNQIQVQPIRWGELLLRRTAPGTFLVRKPVLLTQAPGAGGTTRAAGLSRTGPSHLHPSRVQRKDGAEA